MLRDQIVWGVADEGLQKFAEPNLTFDQPLDLAITAETNRRNVQDVGREYDLCSPYGCKRTD